MPYITFMWHPKSEDLKVAPLVDPLRAVADLNAVSFYVQSQEDSGEQEPVVVRDDVSLPQHVLQHLRGLANSAGVTIYVNPPE
jgi:hypothetical protein